MPHAFTWPYSGDQIPSHPKPPEGGYYSNWDPYSVELTLEPMEDVNPVQTQHVLIATVKDAKGKPLPNRRVEWIIADGSVGDIVEVDESGWRASRGYKMGNDFAVSHTNNFAHVLTRGNDDPSDDIQLGVGQTWCTITSAVEGDTHIIAYAPGIYNWDNHKVFAVKHWYDVAWECPTPGRNPIGTSHEFVTRVTKYSDGTPLEGYLVTYKIVDGPSGTLSNGGAVRSDSNGEARVTLTQTTPAEGTNNLEIDIMRPEDIQCCKPAVHIATCYTSKTWVAPCIEISKSAPTAAKAGEQFQYNIVVSNPCEVAATNVQVTDNLPPGISFVSSNPPSNGGGSNLSWSLGELAGGGSTSITVNVTGTGGAGCTEEVYENCAEVRADYSLSARACATTRIGNPCIEIEKACPSQVLLCDPIDFQITVRNTGTDAATNVRIDDQLPDGLITDAGNRAVFADVGTLQAGEARQATFRVKAERSGTFRNVATVTADGGLTASAECTTTVTTPVLSVTKTGPSQRFLGRDATYEITVSNTGDGPARDVVLTDSQNGASITSVSDGGSGSGGSASWNLGTMQPGQSRTVSVTVMPSQAGTISDTAVARGYCCEAQASFQTEIKGIPAVLLEVVDVEDPDEVGTTDTYIITVTNQGTATDTNIMIKAFVQPEAEFVSGDGPTPASASGREVTFAPLPSLAPKQKASWRVIVRANQTGDTRFRVTMDTDQLTGPPVEETESTRFYE